MSIKDKIGIPGPWLGLLIIGYLLVAGGMLAGATWIVITVWKSFAG